LRAVWPSNLPALLLIIFSAILWPWHVCTHEEAELRFFMIFPRSLD
jgi:hypothetical protein